LPGCQRSVDPERAGRYDAPVAKRKPGKENKPASRRGNAFEALVKDLRAGNPRPAYLLHGEDQALTRDRARRLIEAAIPESARAMNLWEVMGPSQDAADLVGKLKTPSLMPGLVAVVWYDANVFQGGKRKSSDFGSELMRIADLWAEDEHKPAAQIFLALSAEAGFGPDDIDPAGFTAARWLAALELEQDARGAGCLDDVTRYCREQGLEPRSAGAAAQSLAEGLAAGFSERNFLVLTTSKVLRGAELYKRIAEAGAVIDCSPVLDARRSVDTAMEHLARLSRERGLKLPPAALHAIAERVGASPGQLEQELEKVASAAGDDGAVSLADVEDLVQHTREDPIWELTRAVTDRNPQQALAETTDRLRRGTFPLMLLGAVANQWRRLAWARSVAETRPDLDPGRARNRVDFGTRVKAWVKESESKLGRWAVGNRKPYGVFMLFDQSFNYELNELERGFLLLRDADLALKGSFRSPADVLTQLLIDLLGSPKRH